MTKAIKAFKGFHMDMTCGGYQFEVGKSYSHKGNVTVCFSGFHSCEYPLDVFGYYEPNNSRYAIVKATGKTDNTGDDTKFAASRITIEAEITLPDMVRHAVDWIKAQLDPEKTQTVIPGYRSAATNTGDQSAATNTGYRSAATNTGYQSAATNTGYQSAATNTGNRSAATNTGYRSTATNTGDWSAVSVGGKSAVALASGYESKAKACEGSAIVCVYRDDNFNLIHIRASKVGENGIKPDTWYTLNEDGEFVEDES